MPGDSDADPDIEAVRGWARELTGLARHPRVVELGREILAECAPELGEPIETCPVCGRCGVASRLRATDCPHDQPADEVAP